MPEMHDPIRLLRDAPVDAGRLAKVRGRVLSRLERSRPWMGPWILAGAGALALSFASLWLSRTEELRLPAVASSAPAPPDWALDPPRPALTSGAGANDRLLTRAAQWDQRIVSRAREGAVTSIAPRIVSTGEDTALLEIPTSNPDVVLYWLVDSGGD
jgi:hypothetical protein